MRKYYLTLMTSLTLLLIGCAKDEDVNHYTEQQQKAFDVFYGTFVDNQYTTFEPNKITFNTNYETPNDFYENDYMSGKTLLFTAQGECTYHNYQISNSTYESINCYFYINSDVSIFNLYYKGGIDDKKLFQSFSISIKSESEFTLLPDYLTWPYVFKRE